MIVLFALAVAIFFLSLWTLFPTLSFNELTQCLPSRWKLRNSSVKLPPGSLGWPFIGEMLDIVWSFKITCKPDDFIWKRRAKYGDTGIYRTHLFGCPSILTCSPEFNQFVLGRGTEDGSFGPGWPSPELLGTTALVSLEGHEHKRVRRYVMQAINSPEALKSVFSVIQPNFKAAFEDWVSKGTINAFSDLKTVAFRNICAVVMGLKEGPVLNNIETLYKGVLPGFRARTINVPGTAFYYARQCRKKLSAILLSEIRYRKLNNVEKPDFLQSLMDSVDSDGEKMSEEEVLDNIISFLFAGFDSSKSVTMWSLYYLAKYPHVLQKLREENVLIREQKEHDHLLVYEDTKKMTYTSKVVDEVIRLSNVSSYMFRTVAKDVDFNGYRFPKGWKTIIWLRTLHVDPQHFENPLEFNPDRWDRSNLRSGIYQVFGYGPRLCPGNNLARLQLMMFLHYVCIDYKWELVNPDAGITFFPKPKPADGGEIRFSAISQ
eukprot:Gb_28385 [translate_table: standard]